MTTEERKKLMGLVTRWRKAASREEKAGGSVLLRHLVSTERSIAADLERVLTSMPAEEPALCPLGHCPHCSVDSSFCNALDLHLADVPRVPELMPAALAAVRGPREEEVSGIGCQASEGEI